MPTRINGIGTGYYGKRNVTIYEGVCESCGKPSKLRSYDTTLYFCFFYIPIVPLGQKRVLNYCPRCTRHRVLSLTQWEELRRQSTESAAQAFRMTPSDPALAMKAMRAAAAFEQRAQFEALLPEMQRAQSESADVQMVLGGVAAHFGMDAEAERAYRTALKLRDDDTVRERLADALIRQMKPDEADSLLQHVARRGDASKANLLFRLAEGFQAVGRHDRALQILDDVKALAPKVAKNKIYRQVRRSAEQNRTKTAPIVSPRLSKPTIVRLDGSDFAGRLARWAFPILALLALGGYVFAAWREGQARPVWIVGGLSQRYTVRVNGEAVHVVPGSPQRATVPEGDVRVEFPGPAVKLDPLTVRIATPFWSRPFEKREIVINPDRVALLRTERAEYTPGSNDQPPAENAVQYRTGAALLEFKDIAFVFQPLPDQIKLAGDRAEFRTNLTLVDASNSIPVLRGLESLIGTDQTSEALENARRHAQLEPAQGDYVLLLEQLMQPKPFIDFVKTGLEARPVRVHWHRAYQEAMDQLGMTAQLTSEYDAMLAKDPQNAELIYLAGRARDDPDKSEEFYRRAAAATPPSPWALYALDYDLLSTGRFEEALPYAEQSAKLQPDDAAIQALYSETLLANRQFDKMTAQLATIRKLMGGTLDLTSVRREIVPLALKGDEAGANKLIQRLLESFRIQGAGSDDLEVVKNGLNGELAYIKGQPEEAVKDWAHVANHEFSRRATSGDWQSAIDYLDKNPNTSLDLSGHLLVALLARKAGNSAMAAKHVDEAIKVLEGGGTVEKTWAAALRLPDQADPAQLLKTTLDAQDKVLLLTLAGQLAPTLRVPLYPMARKLNFHPAFPHLLIESILTGT